MTAVLSLPPVPVMRRLRLANVHVAGFAADEGFVNFDFAAKLAPKEIILQGQAGCDAA